MDQAHKSKFLIHSGPTRMYRDLTDSYWWPCINRDVAWSAKRCLTCRKVNTEHQMHHEKMKPLDILMWKWEQITKDFITKLPKTPRRVDTIWVIVDRLTKSVYFVPIQESSSNEKLVEIYVKEEVSQHRVPVSIVSDRHVCFTSRFWRKFHDELGTSLHISRAYHPHIDG